MKKNLFVVVLVRVLIIVIVCLSISCHSGDDDDSPDADNAAQGNADKTPPRVIMISPTRNASHVCLDSIIVAHFSEDIFNQDEAIQSADNFIVKQNDENIEGETVFELQTLIFKPKNNFHSNKEYNVTVKSSIKDMAGNRLEEDFSWSFSTGYENDAVQPRIISTTPECNASNTPLDGIMSITFSEVMNPTSFLNATIKVFDGSGQIEGEMRYAGQTVLFCPAQELQAQEYYFMEMENLPTDLAGNSLNSMFSCSFITGLYPDITPPSIVSTMPSCGSVDVSPNIKLSITFSEPMDPASLFVIPFYINDGSKDIGGTITYSGVTGIFVPDEALQPDTTYFATISTNPTDLSGNHLEQPVVCQFTTGSEFDFVQPTVIATTPYCGQNDVPLNTGFTTTFSEPMDPGSLQIIPFRLHADDHTIGGTIKLTGVTASFLPDEDLRPNTIYSAEISTNPRDLAGNYLYVGLKCVFTTGTSYDLTPPEIVSTSPALDQNDVPLNRSLAFTFSEPIDPDTIEPAFILLKNGEYIPSTIDYNGLVAVFTPSVAMVPNENYKMKMSQTLTDLSGNPMADEYVCSFKTGSENDETPPRILNTQPSCNEQNVSTDVTITVNFSEEMKPSSVYIIPLSLKNNGTRIDGIMKLEGKVLFFTPYDSLNFNTVYTLKISSNPMDLAGNRLEEEFVCAFTTQDNNLKILNGDRDVSK